MANKEKKVKTDQELTHERVAKEQNKLMTIPLNGVVYSDIPSIEEGYSEKLATDPKYSMVVDPENLYNMTDLQKRFVKAWIQFMNFAAVASYMNIEVDEAKVLFEDFAVQQEIRRIRLAQYMRQFNMRMLSINEIGGYLTSVLVDEVPLSERLTSQDKIKVAKMLIDLNVLKHETLEKPGMIEYTEVEADLKKLSAKSLKNMIANSLKENPSEEKNNLIKELDTEGSFTPEDISYLRTMSMAELKSMKNNPNVRFATESDFEENEDKE